MESLGFLGTLAVKALVGFLAFMVAIGVQSVAYTVFYQSKKESARKSLPPSQATPAAVENALKAMHPTLYALDKAPETRFAMCLLALAGALATIYWVF